MIDPESLPAEVFDYRQRPLKTLYRPIRPERADLRYCLRIALAVTSGVGFLIGLNLHPDAFNNTANLGKLGPAVVACWLIGVPLIVAAMYLPAWFGWQTALRHYSEIIVTGRAWEAEIAGRSRKAYDQLEEHRAKDQANSNARLHNHKAGYLREQADALRRQHLSDAEKRVVRMVLELSFDGIAGPAEVAEIRRRLREKPFPELGLLRLTENPVLKTIVWPDTAPDGTELPEDQKFPAAPEYPSPPLQPIPYPHLSSEPHIEELLKKAGYYANYGEPTV